MTILTIEDLAEFIRECPDYRLPYRVIVADRVDREDHGTVVHEAEVRDVVVIDGTSHLVLLIDHGMIAEEDRDAELSDDE